MVNFLVSRLHDVFNSGKKWPLMLHGTNLIFRHIIYSILIFSSVTTESCIIGTISKSSNFWNNFGFPKIQEKSLSTFPKKCLCHHENTYFQNPFDCSVEF